MFSNPVKALDELIKGVVLVTYDFVRLTVFGFILPFFKNNHRIGLLIRATIQASSCRAIR